MYRFLFILYFICFYFILLVAQNDTIIQFSGIVIDKTSSQTLEFTTIIINNKKGTITDRYGRFSFLVNMYDTIMFSSVGYKKDTIIINSINDFPFFISDVLLERDTILIDEVEILPWATYKDFTEAFCELKLQDDDLARAERNIELMQKQALLSDESDPIISYRNSVNAEHEKNFSYGMYPTISLLNPFAWARFFDALKNGDFKRK